MDQYQYDQIDSAARRGNLKRLKELVTPDNANDYLNGCEQTVLLLCISHDDPNCVQWLLEECNADPHKICISDSTFHATAIYFYPAAMYQFLKHGVKADTPSPTGDTPLTQLLRVAPYNTPMRLNEKLLEELKVGPFNTKQKECASLLIAAGAKTNLVTINDRLPFVPNWIKSMEERREQCRQSAIAMASLKTDGGRLVTQMIARYVWVQKLKFIANNI